MKELNRVTVKGLRKAVELACKTGTTLFVMGTFGIGKTEIVSSVLRSLGYDPVDWFRGSTMTPDTIAGIPYKDGPELKRAIPEIVAACRGVQRPALVLDEVNIATPFMLGAMLQLFLDGRLGEYELPEGTPRIAMGNMEDDGSIVTQLPLPAANRMRHVLFAGPTFEEWQEWALNNGIHPAIISFLKERPEYLIEYAQADRVNDGRLRWATPRTWAMASRHMQFIGDDLNENIALIASFVGDAAAAAMNMHLRMSFDLVDVKDIIEDPNSARLQDASATAACYMQLTKLVQDCPTEQDAATAAITYVKRMDPMWLPVFLSMAHARTELEVALFMAGAAGIMSDEEFDAFVDLDAVQAKAASIPGVALAS